VFTLLNSFYDDLNLNRVKIENIEILNIDGHQRSAKDIKQMFDIYSSAMLSSKLENKLSDRNLTSLADRTYGLLKNSFKDYTGLDKKGLEAVMSNLDGTEFKDLSLEKLEEIRRAFIKEYPYLGNKTLSPTINFEDPKEFMFSILQVAILSKSNMSLSGDFMNMRDFSVT
jgi:hypothetical protein